MNLAVPGRPFPRRIVSGTQRAAVAVAVVPDGDGYGFVLTQRSKGMRQHAGQLALPGGRCEPGEDPAQSALRETHEEVGVASDAWQVADMLDDYPLSAEMVITPVVLVAHERPAFQRNDDEVAEVFVVRMPAQAPSASWFRPEQQPFGAPSAGMAQALALDAFHLFAPTGAIVEQFLHWALHGRVRRVSHVAPPAFVADDAAP
ncbi:NUDIX hydrolase [Streptomyces sp. Inha503]|uniref:NUDIX hydrolase n=1 Tax=Streptomyces sp. Inha503 TaxID=3383314 RepID=UPI0039A18DE2